MGGMALGAALLGRVSRAPAQSARGLRARRSAIGALALGFTKSSSPSTDWSYASLLPGARLGMARACGQARGVVPADSAAVGAARNDVSR
jgi:hypothetical protein